MVRLAIRIIMETTSSHQEWIFIFRRPQSYDHIPKAIVDERKWNERPNGPLDTFFEAPAKAEIKTNIQTMVSQTCPLVRRFSELRN